MITEKVVQYFSLIRSCDRHHISPNVMTNINLIYLESQLDIHVHLDI